MAFQAVLPRSMAPVYRSCGEMGQTTHLTYTLPYVQTALFRGGTEGERMYGGLTLLNGGAPRCSDFPEPEVRAASTPARLGRDRRAASRR
jgi:hypothetical protein